MIKLVTGLVLIVLGILLIGAYLSPDDLAKCDASPSEEKGCQAADVIVAVSGGDTSARTDEAVSLYKHGWAPVLIFSGAAADKSGPSNASAMRRRAEAAGVPKNVIITEESSETTKQNAELSGGVVARNEYRRVILVTSGYHQRRASIEFGNFVGSGVQVVNHPVRSDNQWSYWWWATPTGWWLALSELVKIVLVYAGVSR